MIKYNLALIGYGYWGPKLARNIQKDLGFDTGVHKKIMFNNDEISSNLDNMISELENL